MRVFLSGPMGAGKSSAGAALATRLGFRFVDLDAAIEARAGRSVRDIFVSAGEAAFRVLEDVEVRRVLAAPDDVVVALGGGTVTNPSVRRTLLAGGILLTLEAPTEILAGRVGDEGRESRPLLASESTREDLERIVAARAAAYAECHGTISTVGLSIDEVATRVEALLSSRPIVVPQGARTYRVHVGRGVRAELPSLISALQPRASSCLVVSDEHVYEPWARESIEALRASRLVAEGLVLPSGEVEKTIRTVERIWDAALRARIDRQAILLSIGGGVVGDMTGFAASTLLRGVSVAHLPTTLLAMSDSAIGGKTGIDRPEGKNLVGSFHAPRFVLCDVDVLVSLPVRDFRAGLAEVAKSAWLDGEAAVATIEADAELLVRRDAAALERAVRIAAGLKARIVAADERERGARALLNLGHTVGHALEAATGYSLLHGEAVALGLAAAFGVAEERTGLEACHGERMRTLLSRLGLPIRLAPWAGAPVQSFLASDKKRTGDVVRYVMPGRPGETAVVPLPLDELWSILARLLAGLGASGS